MQRILNAVYPVAGMAIGLFWTISVYAQQGGPGYQAPNSPAISAGFAHPGGPTMPTSPQAGAIMAAQGDAFMDAHGAPVVLPAAYCQGCQTGHIGHPTGGGYDGYGAGGGGSEYCGVGGDSGMACAGLKGCGYVDQSGPHYFDVSADVVFLLGERLFDNVPAFTSIGVGGPRVLDPTEMGEYEPGWKIAVRYDLGPLSLFEATYMGLYNIGWGDMVRSPDVTNGEVNSLFSMFSNYGVPPGVPIPGVDFANVAGLAYESDLQSTELTFRRYWVGKSPRVSGTYLVGFRYLRLTERLTYNTESLVNPPNPNQSIGASRLWGTENDLLGAQIGGDGWISLCQGLRLGGELKAGIYNNRYGVTNAGDFRNVLGVPGVPDDFLSASKGNQVAFAAEGSASVVIDILPCWSLRGDYRVLYINSLATAGGNVDPSNYFSTAVQTQADGVYHGFSGGVEYIW